MFPKMFEIVQIVHVGPKFNFVRIRSQFLIQRSGCLLQCNFQEMHFAYFHYFQECKEERQQTTDGV